MPSLAREEGYCCLPMVRWCVKLAVLVKTSTNVNPDAESTWKVGFASSILTDGSPGQRSRFGIQVRSRAEGRRDECVSTGNEHGSTLERNNASIEEQYKLARESFEPQTEAENDELIVQGCISHHRYCDRSGFSPYQMVFGITRRMPRSLTNDDELETIEVPKDQHWIVNAHTTVEWRPLQLSSSKTRTTELQGRVRRVLLPDIDQQLVNRSWYIVTNALNRRLLWWFW